MPPRLNRRLFLLAGVASLQGIASMGCGTVLHPERKGQPAGDLDWSIVALDAVGLIFFFVPGVIAFAVDFNNGSIYLPPDEYSRLPPPSYDVGVSGRAGADGRRTSETSETMPDMPKLELTPIAVGHDRPTLSEIESTLAKHTGKKVDLLQEGCETHSLKSLKDFWKLHADVANRIS